MALYINDKETGNKKLIAGHLPVDNILDVNSNNTIANATVTKEINELKKSVSDGKNKLAGAITTKGIETASADSFDTMAENIEKISSGGDIEFKTDISKSTISYLSKNIETITLIQNKEVQ